MLETITHLVTNFGYIIVAVFILLECAGFPLPGETALLVAAGFAGAGKLSIITVIIIAASSAIIGDAGGYWLGRLFGRGFVERFGKYVGLNDKKMDFLQGFFVKNGALTVFFGRFVSILRTYSAIFAGISKMPYVSFTIFNALGGIFWALIFGTLGYVFGQNLDEVENLIRIFGWGALVGLGIFAAGWYMRKFTKASTEEYTRTPGLKGVVSRFISGSALVTMRNGISHLSRFAVIMLFSVGLTITALMILFISGTTHSLSEYDPLVRFEELMSTMIDELLTQSQSMLFLYIAKFGSALSVGLGFGTAVLSFFLKRRLYMFTMLFGIVGGEALNALLAFLNRGYSVFVSSHLSVRLSYLFIYDNMIIPIVVFGMLAYFAVSATKQMLSALSVLIGLSIPALIIVVCFFLCGLHGGIAFFEELLCAIVWLWICIGLIQFIRIKQQQSALVKEIEEGE